MVAVIRDKDMNVLYSFKPSFRVEGLPKNREIPAMIINGRSGEVITPQLIREESRNIAIIGELYADGGNQQARKEAIENELDDIMLPIGKKEEVFISKDEDENRFIPAYYVDVEHDFIERTARTLATCRFQFNAYNPFWFNTVDDLFSEVINFTPATVTIEIENEGSAPIHPLIIIEGEVLNPKLTNNETGQIFEYTGNLSVGEILAINPYTREVIKTTNGSLDFSDSVLTDPDIRWLSGDSVIGQVNDDFLIKGFHLENGINEIEIEDANQNMELSIRYREKWL